MTDATTTLTLTAAIGPLGLEYVDPANDPSV
jgi:hypothetical protein